MRDGRTVLDATMGEVSRYDLVSTMLGRELTKSEREQRHVETAHAAGDALLSARQIRNDRPS